MAKNRMPNLMDELLTGKKDDSIPARQQSTSKPVSQHDSKPVKATYYLPESILIALEEKRLQLRKAGKKLSKSQIVEIALKEYLK